MGNCFEAVASTDQEGRERSPDEKRIAGVTISKGDIVQLTEDTWSDGKDELFIPKDTTGTVQRIDKVGDACIKFEDFTMRLWIKVEKFELLLKKVKSLKDMIMPGGRDGTAFTEDQQSKFGVNEEGVILDQSKYDGAIVLLQQVRQRMDAKKVQVLSLDDFMKRRIDAKSIVHLKGFGHGLEDKYQEETLKTISKYQVLVWDGDPYDITGFTKMVPKFLDTNKQGECIAFRLDYEVDDFKESWADVIEQYPGRISIVSIDLKFPSLVDARRLGVLEEMAKAAELPDWAQEYFLLGRVACQATRSSLVISMGGGGISKSEAVAGIAIGVEWEVIDLRRKPNPGNPVGADGWRDEKGFALMDWIRNESGKAGSSIVVETSGRKYRLRQVSRGNSDDLKRVADIKEAIATIKKAQVQINELSSAMHTPYPNNQITRWMNTKEEHAAKIITTVSEYCLCQRVKPVHDIETPFQTTAGYIAALRTHHALMLAAVKCKQTVDSANADALEAAATEMSKMYLPA